MNSVIEYPMSFTCYTYNHGNLNRIEEKVEGGGCNISECKKKGKCTISNFMAVKHTWILFKKT